MLRLLKAELFKLFKNKTFIVLCLICLLLAGVMSFLSTDIASNMLQDSLAAMPQEQAAMLKDAMAGGGSIVTPGQMGFHLAAKNPFSPTAIEIFHAAFGNGVIEVLIAILMSGILVREYTQGTIKNTLAYGKKRRDFYLAKFFAAVLGVSILLLILTVIPTIACTILKGWGVEFEFSQILLLIATFLSGVVTTSSVVAIIMIIAILTQSNAAVIGAGVGLFTLVPNLIGFLYGKYDWFDKVFEITPFYTVAASTSVYATNSDLINVVVIAAVTIIIALFIGIRTFEKQDVK